MCGAVFKKQCNYAFQSRPLPFNIKYSSTKKQGCQNCGFGFDFSEQSLIKVCKITK